jgi:hypothetical protein
MISSSSNSNSSSSSSSSSSSKSVNILAVPVQRRYRRKLSLEHVEPNMVVMLAQSKLV